MKNLGNFVIKNTEGKYKSLADITGLTFEAGKKYYMQVQNSLYLCEGENGGFLINSPILITYIPDEEPLKVKSASDVAYINIAG